MTYFNNLGQARVGWRIPSGGVTPSYLLDTYTGATVAYSLRKLRTAYTGNAIRVRRSSDDTTLDIGFNANGELDTASMLSFVGSNNQALYSEEFDNVYWNKYIVSVTSNQTTAPDGTMTADLLAESSANNGHTLLANLNVLTFAIGTSWNISVYVKKGPGTAAPDTFILGWNTINTPTHPAVLFNISSGIVLDSLNPTNDTNFGSSIVDAGNGWWRCSMWGTVTVAGNRYQVGSIRFNNNLNTINGANYAGNAQANMYIWGYQFQKALNNTSVLTTQPYIKTTATANAGNGFISIWYDQSGTATNLTQEASANQPQIVSSGALITRSGKPYFTCSTTQFLTLVNVLQFISVPYSMWMTYEKTATGNNSVIASTVINYMYLDYGTSQQLSTRPNSTITISPALSINTRYLINGMVNVTNTGGNNVTSSLYINNSLRGTNAASVTWLGSYASTQVFPSSTSGYRVGTITTNEWIVYKSNQSTNRAAIESNINSFYTIY